MTEASRTPATLDNELETMAKRRKISETIRQVVLLEAGYKCANPTCRHVLTLELHHIVWVKDNGGNQPDNLLALCPNCHSLHTTGHIPAQAILTWKSLLTSLGNPNRAAVDLLLVLADEEARVGKEMTLLKHHLLFALPVTRCPPSPHF
jgi:hypothetical protein